MKGMSQMDQTRARGDSENSWSPSQRTAIWAEAHRILADPAFKKSRRCVVLFRHLIEHALSGSDEGGVKERTLGIEVFGREADYDTNTDPIVRMTANEIRKRLAQYYQSSKLHHEVHIGLVAGSYLPQFNFELHVLSPETPPQLGIVREIVPETIAEPAVAAGPELPVAPAESNPDRRRIRWIAYALAAVIMLIAIVFVALSWTNLFRSNQYLLWAPLLKTSAPVVICVGDTSVSQVMRGNAEDYVKQLADRIDGRNAPIQAPDDFSIPLTPYVDAEVSARVAGWLKGHGKRFRLVRASRTSLEDFRQGPVVLVGAFSNTWNLTLFSKLRFHVKIDPATMDEWIEDLQNPASREWKSSGKLLYSDSSVDYAIITRVFNKDTGTWFIVAGGLGMHATEAAGDLLTDPDFSSSLPEAVRSVHQNFQIVLKSTVIGGHIGAPHILAVYTW
jgi:hypothetical protein